MTAQSVEVQDAGRGRHDPNRASGQGHGSCERFRAGRIRAGRRPTSTSRSVTRMSPPSTNPSSTRATVANRASRSAVVASASPNRLGAPAEARSPCEPRQSAASSTNTASGTHQAALFLDPDTRRFQCSPITDVLVDERSEVRVGAIVDSETIDHALGSRTNEPEKVDRTRHGQCSETIRRNFFVRS